MPQPLQDLTEELDQLLQDAVKLHQDGQLAEAEGLYRRILKAAPNHAETLSMMGVLAAQSGNLRSGRELVKAAIAQRPDHAGYRFNLAHILHMAGDPAAANAYRETLNLDPRSVPALVNLGNLMAAAGRLESAIDCFETALGIDPTVVVALEGLGMALQKQQRIAEAITAFERAVTLDPGNANTQNNLGALLLEAGRNEDAITRITAALERLPGRADLHSNLGVALFSTGRPQEALDQLEKALQLDPAYTRALGMKGLVKSALGDTAAASAIFDYDRLLASTQLTSVPGYPDIASFNAALAQQVLAHPSLMVDRPGKTTRIGSQTEDLLDGASGAVALLGTVVERAVQDYFSVVAGAAARPFPVPIPSRWRLALWATVLRSGGYQDPHNHPGRILSGVYYVQLPVAFDDTHGENQGAIEFGTPPERLGMTTAVQRRLIRPVEGQLLLFPSHFWHRTVPAFGDRDRISVAFDVLADE